MVPKTILHTHQESPVDTVYIPLSPRLSGDDTLCAFGSTAQGLALQRSLLSHFFSFKKELDLILGDMPHSL